MLHPMEYDDLLRDFTKRTLANVACLGTVHEETKERPDTDAPFIVTARLGAFLSIIVVMVAASDHLNRSASRTARTT